MGIRSTSYYTKFRANPVHFGGVWPGYIITTLLHAGVTINSQCTYMPVIIIIRGVGGR